MILAPTPQAAHALIAGVNASSYAKTRNNLNGDVTRLSCYITHGITNIPTVVARLNAQRPMSFQDKIIFEFAWREFFHHVWSIKGDSIFKGLRESVYAGRYLQNLPDDIAQGRTGVPAIDASVRELYATGYLHNHARMWLASYTVHLRKVHWRVGADWLYAHLLDGDCASNHLSWQWVAGTFSSKPYLFNADNVAQYATSTTHGHWHSQGTVIDQSYEAIDAWARSSKQAQAEPGHHSAVEVPKVSGVPDACTSSADLAQHIRGKHVRLVHPWDLADDADARASDHDASRHVTHESSDVSKTSDLTAQHVNLAWLCPDFHTALPWSQARWDWVLARMRQLCPVMVVGDSTSLAAVLAAAKTVDIQHTQHAAYLASIKQLTATLNHCTVTPQPALLPQVATLCNSFTKYYQTAQALAGRLEHCL